MDGGDGIASMHLLQCDLRRGVHLLGEPSLAQNQGQCIVKQGDVRGSDQLLWIAASLPKRQAPAMA